MSFFQIIAVLLTLTALMAYLNHRVLKLPQTIGLMALALVFSFVLIGLSWALPGSGIGDRARAVLDQVDFDAALLNGMLGFLLFAGALHVDMARLWARKRPVALLATLGVVISTALVGVMTWGLFGVLGLEVKLIYCLLFGALISPTDPIAVLAILKTLGAPESLETKIAGESLFNDGVGVVVFLALMGVAGFDAHASGHGPPTASIHTVETLAPASAEAPGHATGPAKDSHEVVEELEHVGVDLGEVSVLFAKETLGGAAFGLAIGFIAFLMLKSVDEYKVEVMITLAMVAGGYALASAWGVSGPIAMVVSGLLIGNHGRAEAMSDKTREHVDKFWELIDEILNAVLFVLIGLEVLVLTFDEINLEAGLVAIPLVLLARFVSVSVPMLALRHFHDVTPHAIKMLTWGGLRGGISVALALSLKESLGQADPLSYQAILFMTYTVVVFSIIVQGLTIPGLLRRLNLGH
ncbi:MAG: sodium:proton antiporter [Phycisphaerales bacterium]